MPSPLYLPVFSFEEPIADLQEYLVQLLRTTEEEEVNESAEFKLDRLRLRVIGRSFIYLHVSSYLFHSVPVQNEFEMSINRCKLVRNNS